MVPLNLEPRDVLCWGGATPVMPSGNCKAGLYSYELLFYLIGTFNLFRPPNF